MTPRSLLLFFRRSHSSESDLTTATTAFTTTLQRRTIKSRRKRECVSNEYTIVASSVSHRLVEKDTRTVDDDRPEHVPERAVVQR